jgi:hypothetical protein
MRMVVPALLLLMSVPAGGVELQAGQQYPGGTRIESPADGISFVIPEEWLGGLPPDAVAFVLGSNTRQGIGMVIMSSSASWPEIELFLNQPQDLGDGIVLSPVATGQRTARGYEISLGHPVYAGHAIGRVSEQGNAVIVFFGGPAEQRDYFVQLASRTTDSVAFSAPRESSTVQQWRAHLAGMMLKRMDSYYSGGLDGSYVGGSSSETLHLCSDGSYAYFSSSSVAADAGGGTSGHSGGQGGTFGQWSVQTAGARVLLALRPAGGAASQHVLHVEGDKTFVDGSRAYRVRSDRCQ